jgi:excisionase family DNA binding protein
VQAVNDCGDLVADAVEIIVLNPGYWAHRPLQLSQLLGAGTARPIADPTGTPPNPESVLTFVDPSWWSTQPRELQEALNIAAGKRSDGQRAGGLGSGAVPAGPERLMLTVEEAAKVLGISRAFAYEAVRRGDIPHIKIGRRLLVPKAALQRLLASAMPEESDEIPPNS